MKDRIFACLGVGLVVGCAASLIALLVELSPRLFAAAFVAGALWCWVAWDLE